MSKHFLHSGSLGDIIYSLPTIRAMGGGTLHVKRALFHAGYDQFTASERLLRCQPYLHDVLPYPAQYDQFQHDPNIHLDHDLDVARLQPNRSRVHIIKRHLDAMGVQLVSWRDPWLTVPSPPVDWFYSLIHVTPRYRERSRVDWAVIRQLIPEPVFFIGFKHEHEAFEQFAGPIPYLPTRDLLDMARAIAGADALYCNQSVGLTLAQGLGKPYFLERHVNRINCLLFTSNEHIL